MRHVSMAALLLVVAAMAAPSARGAPGDANETARSASETVAPSSDASMAAANEAYFAGDFAIAIARYEAVVDAGVVHEELYYNLGNAYFRAAAANANRLGRAIYNYERALRLEPTFEDARYNLEVARAAVAATIADRLEAAEADPFWVRQATRFSLGTLSVALAVASYLFFGALFARRYLATGLARAGTTAGALLIAFAAGAIGLLLAAQLYFQNRVDMAVVLPDQVELREAPDRRSSERGIVHAGLRVRLVDRQPGWFRVRLANGHEGWLVTGTVGKL